MKETGFNFQNTYTDLPSAFYHVDSPVEFAKPEVVVVNEELEASLGLDFSLLSEDEKALLFCGNAIPDGSVPFSQAYAGHQFGNFTMLGDGRAHMLGEHVTPEGERFDLQFKGSGPTPYSRRGDGLAAIGPMLREYIISEAMHGLGIPTTRSLAVVSTGEKIMRERALPGAVLTRVASSHIRVGTFEYAAALQRPELLLELLNYTVERHFPACCASERKALDLLRSVMERQVLLIVQWMRVGFIHGVMNTDNMALSGESIDFGPCAFMDSYNPDQVFSSIDQYGRYAFSNQAPIAQWNLARLAEALLPLIDRDENKAVEQAKEILLLFQENYEKEYLTMMRQKLGLLAKRDEDEKLIAALLDWMQQAGADYTNTFRDLSSMSHLSGEIYGNSQFLAWYTRYEKRRDEDEQSIEESVRLMRSVNPTVIPRNHLVEKALELGEADDLEFMHELLAALKNPYDYENEALEFQSPPEPSDRFYQTFCGT